MELEKVKWTYFDAYLWKTSKSKMGISQNFENTLTQPRWHYFKGIARALRLCTKHRSGNDLIHSYPPSKPCQIPPEGIFKNLTCGFSNGLVSLLMKVMWCEGSTVPFFHQDCSLGNVGVLGPPTGERVDQSSRFWLKFCYDFLSLSSLLFSKIE